MQTLAQNLLNGIAAGSIYALIALGYTMVYGILKLINFAHGDVFMLGAFTGFYSAKWWATASHQHGAPQPSWIMAVVVLIVAMVACGLFGFLNERIAYRPLRHAPRIASLITAIGVSFFLEYGGQFVFGPDPQFFPTLIEKHLLTYGGVTNTNYKPILLGVAPLFMGMVEYIFFWAQFRRGQRALSLYLENAPLLGIPTPRPL